MNKITLALLAYMAMNIGFIVAFFFWQGGWNTPVFRFVTVFMLILAVFGLVYIDVIPIPRKITKMIGTLISEGRK